MEIKILKFVEEKKKDEPEKDEKEDKPESNDTNGKDLENSLK